MKLYGKDILYALMQMHADVREQINAWIAEVEGVSWITPQDIKDRYSSASFLPGNIVIFNIKGGTYRLEVEVAYKTGHVIVKWAGTHAEYDKRYK